jgi:hypothetical protein
MDALWKPQRPGYDLARPPQQRPTSPDFRAISGSDPQPPALARSLQAGRHRFDPGWLHWRRAWRMSSRAREHAALTCAGVWITSDDVPREDGGCDEDRHRYIGEDAVGHRLAGMEELDEWDHEASAPSIGIPIWRGIEKEPRWWRHMKMGRENAVNTYRRARGSFPWSNSPRRG